MGILGGVVAGVCIILGTGLGIRVSEGLHVTLSRGLLIGFYYGLDIGISTAQYVGLDMSWLSILSGGLLAFVATGGLAVLRHIVLRLLLSQARAFPWQAESFLEDARTRNFLRRVGRGYSFMHRLLLDYFADLYSGHP